METTSERLQGCTFEVREIGPNPFDPADPREWAVAAVSPGGTAWYPAVLNGVPLDDYGASAEEAEEALRIVMQRHLTLVWSRAVWDG